MNQLLVSMPDSIQSKIMTYLLSYGTAIAKIIKPIVYETINERVTTLWFAKIHKSNAYLMNHYTNCPYDVLCDLRLATCEHDAYLPRTHNMVQRFLKTFSNFRLVRLIEEEKISV
jgi:hypothetical protein